MATADAQMRAYYEQGKERDRLAGAKGALEFERTKEIIQRRLPPAPGVVADIGYTHRPDDLAGEVSEAGLQLDDLVGVEGLPLPGADMLSRIGDPTAWKVLLDAARAIERVPELLGLSPHLIATATRAKG